MCDGGRNALWEVLVEVGGENIASSGVIGVAD